MIRTRIAVVSLCALMATGCGGGGDAKAPTTFDGTVLGYSLTVKDSLAIVETGKHDRLKIELIDIADVCAAGFLLPTTPATKLVLRMDADAPELPAGEYLLDGAQQGRYAGATFSKSSGECHGAPKANAHQGAIKIDSIDLNPGGKVTGSYDLTFSTGDHVTGTFDAPVCTVDDDDMLIPCD